MPTYRRSMRAAMLVVAAAVALATSGCGTGSGPMKQAPTATYAYVLYEDYGLPNNPTFVAQFRAGSDGTLTPLNPPTVPAGSSDYFNNESSLMTPDPSSQYLFVGNWYQDAPDTISQFVIGSDGTLTPNAIPTIPSNTPAALTFSPNGPFALVADESDATASSYSLGPSGILNLINTVPSSGAEWAVYDPTGQFAYFSGGNSITLYTVSPNGALNLGVTYNTPLGDGLTLSPQGFLYASGLVNYNAALGEFSINTSNGGLSIANTFSEAWYQPVFDPSGSYAYLDNATTISILTIDPSTGGLSSGGPDVASGNCCYSSQVAVDPSGSFLLQTGWTASSSGPADPHIFSFTVGSGGTLTSTGSISLGSTSASPEAIAFVQR
jgi:6-phosphogluconolactonase (cycloisomerase 2 family)